jgi:hypothetical protein
VADGKIAEHWANRDDLAGMAQLGLLPGTPSNPRQTAPHPGANGPRATEVEPKPRGLAEWWSALGAGGGRHGPHKLNDLLGGHGELLLCLLRLVSAPLQH